jgi:hypothetical protein
MQPPDFLLDGPESAPLTVLLAHGAGAPADSPFMTRMAEGLAEPRFRVARFDFPYMAATRRDRVRRPPDRAPVLVACFEAAIAAFAPERLVIGGKSLGGRIATLLADKAGVRGVVCFGYPFHPPGNPERVRAEHLATIATPTLILQGTRDPFGSTEEVPAYRFSPAVRVHWIEDGEHSFKPRAASGRTEDQNLADALAAMAAFVSSRVP